MAAGSIGVSTLRAEGGARVAGETGCAAAGARVRPLPVTPEKVLPRVSR